MALRIRDDRQRELVFLRPPRRIVSLVPSDTLNVAALGGKVIGRTRYCDGDAAVIGGTKDGDVDAVARLEPPMILAHPGEKSQAHLATLAQPRPPLLRSFPRNLPH